MTVAPTSPTRLLRTSTVTRCWRFRCRRRVPRVGVRRVERGGWASRPRFWSGCCLIGGVVAGILIARHQSEIVAQPSSSAPAVQWYSSVQTAKPRAAGVSETGQKAYCARLPPANDIMWSLVSGVVPSPTVTPGPNDQVYPGEIEISPRLRSADRAIARRVPRGSPAGETSTGPRSTPQSGRLSHAFPAICVHEWPPGGRIANRLTRSRDRLIGQRRPAKGIAVGRWCRGSVPGQV